MNRDEIAAQQREDECDRQLAEDTFLKAVTIPAGFTLKLTCETCPEQWEIFYCGAQVGYLRCRHSRWSLSTPDAGGTILIKDYWHRERGRYESNFGDERPEIFAKVFAALRWAAIDP